MFDFWKKGRETEQQRKFEAVMDAHEAVLLLYNRPIKRAGNGASVMTDDLFRVPVPQPQKLKKAVTEYQ